MITHTGKVKESCRQIPNRLLTYSNEVCPYHSTKI
nr:MAG TPA: hypothetical protein [Caudoviricetes sp.]